jgi:pimeloyl-ACP methyl ester carboxylesterase
VRRGAAKNGAGGAIAALLALSALGLSAPQPALALSFSSCQGLRGFSCATLSVPLERGGPATGTITLHIARLLAARTPSSSAVVALAGGPGQAALPLASDLAQVIAPALQTRDLIVFDQRGTGRSGALGCSALERVGAGVSQLQSLIEGCALGLGAGRSGYTTAESIADIEAIRQALGYEKLVLYGTSYGTKVALDYAARYPQSTEAMVLDSVVAPNGPDPFELSTFAAITPVLHELCGRGACRGVSGSPVGDVARLLRRLRGHPLEGRIDDGYGHSQRVRMGALELLFILEAGDLNPALRALLPAAVQSALRGDPAPLLQLNALSQGLIPNVPPLPREHSQEGVDETLFWTTTCEEDPFPWQRGAAPSTRRSEALAALAAIPGRLFYPFSPGVGLLAGPMLDCLRWPSSPSSGAAGGALPDVPTLILSGGQDLRTPTSGARRVAAAIPGSQLLVVPYTGHSVLGSDLSGCAAAGVEEFFAGLQVTGCGRTQNIFSPTPITPTRLSAVAPTPGLAPRDGRTVTAVLDTVLDLDRLIIAATLQAESQLPSGSRFGGLRGGYAALTTRGVRLVRFSFVRGVQLSGTWPIVNGKLEVRPLRVQGSAAAHGTVLLHSDRRVSGTLEGQRFNVGISRAVLARRAQKGAIGGTWSSAFSPSEGETPGAALLSPLARLR